MIAVAPTIFARGQLLRLCSPLVVLVGLAWLAWAGFFRARDGGSGALRVLEYAQLVLMLVVGGGMATIYAGAMFMKCVDGLMFRPKVPWDVGFADETVTIATKRFTTTIRVGDIASLTRVWDDPWEAFRGMEESCLVIRLTWFRGRIVVPGSSNGFESVAEALQERREIRSVDV